jgi:transposase
MVPAVPVLVTGGVDTHADTHTAAALDQLGRALGSDSFPATAAGYQDLTGWLASFGAVEAVGVEGTGCYGAGLSRHLAAAGVKVIDVNRPDRATRRFRGKSDPLDALAAARAVQSGAATATPKTRDDAVESLRVLRVDKDDLTKARAKLITRMKSLIVTAPEPIRAQLKGLTTTKLVKTLASWESPIGKPTDLNATDPQLATIHVLGNMARRYQDLTEQIDDVMAIIAALTAAIAPSLMALPGVGPDTASQLLVSVGGNPERMTNEASLAALTGTCPIPASSGKTTGRHRLNRSGDRQANSAIYQILLSRLRWPTPETTNYIERRTKEGKTKKEIMRCLKRYIVRELYPHLLAAHARPAR